MKLLLFCPVAVADYFFSPCYTVSTIGNNSTREIDLDYEDETTYGGMVSGSWSIGGYDSKYTYECSGISGATDC